MKSFKSFGRIVCLSMAMGCLAGCKRTPKSGVAPGSAVVETASVTKRPTLTIGDAPVEFTPIEFKARADGDGVVVRIDTPGADVETGNVIHFDLMLDEIDDPANLAGAAWQFKSDDPERAETLNAITLRGRSVVLEPIDVHVFFGREGDQATIDIDGQFRWFDPPDAATALKVVTVSGRLWAAYPKLP